MTGIERLRDALADRYSIEAELGRGGMATVYRAYDLRHHRPVALKVFEDESAASVGSERFLREIATAASLSHPRILSVFDSGSDAGIPWYVMPIADGESLRARLTRERQLPIDDVVRITQQVAEALAYAHARRVVHRDIKPDNILMHDGNAMVADFGIARAVASSTASRLTKSGTVIGTPEYMSPEQAAGDATLDGRSDIYSLACVVYEMLSGEPPHTGPTPQAILARQIRGEVRSLRPLRPTVTPALDAVVRRALAPTPADRFRVATDFAEALAVAANPGTDAMPDATSGTRSGSLARWAASHRRAVAAFAVITLAVVAVWTKRPATIGDNRVGLAVFPFRATNAISLPWTERLADYLATTIDGTPGVRVADPWSLWQTLRPARNMPAGSPDPTEATRLAVAAGATRFVLGSLVASGERMELTLRVYQTQRDEPLQVFMDSAPIDSLPLLVQRAAVSVIKQLGIDGRAPGDRRTTGSVESFKAYLAAREAWRRGMLDSADNSIQHAITLDSNFALAWVAAAGIRSWRQYANGQLYNGLIPMAERAVALSDSLSERERLRARAMLASVRTDGPLLAETVTRIIELDSTDLDAWEMLSHSHLVYGWQYGATSTDARVAAEHLLVLDPGSFSGLLRVAQFAAFTGDSLDIRRQLERLRRADTTNTMVASALWYLRAIAASDNDFKAMLEPLARAPAAQWISAFRGVRWSHPERAERLLARVREVAGPGESRRTAITAQIGQLLAEGRLHDVDSLRGVGALREVPTLELLVNLSLVANGIAGARDSIAQTRAVDALTKLVPVDSVREYFATRPVWWAGWALGAYHATFGDSAVARRWQNALGTLPPGGTLQDYRGSLQADLAARLAVRSGDTATALDAARRAFDLWSIHSNNDIDAQPEPAMRFHLATLLRATGRADSASAILQSMVPPGQFVGFYSPRAWLELGALAEQRGDRSTAARYYALAAALWRPPNDAVIRWRDAAVAGLTRLSGSPTTQRLR